MTNPSLAPASGAHPPLDPVVREREAPSFPAMRVVALCVALHCIAAALIYRVVIGELYALFENTSRLLVLEQGLRRLTLATIFLPPIVPTALVLIATVWIGVRRRDPAVARWLSLAAVPLVADEALRALGVSLAPAPATLGELLDLPMRFSPGPRLISDLLGGNPPPAAAYWIVVCSLAAALTTYCVARALFAAEQAALQPAERRRRRRAGDPVAAAQATVMAVALFAGLAFLGRLVLPAAIQLFLRVFG